LFAATWILMQAFQRQMKKDVKVLMDANHARDGPGAAEFAGLVKFEGAYLNSKDQEVAIVLEYMDAGSLEDVKRRVCPSSLPH
jgi:serine/threonine protein kinase